MRLFLSAFNHVHVIYATYKKHNRMNFQFGTLFPLSFDTNYAYFISSL